MARPVSQGGIDYPDGGFSSGTGSFPMIGDLAELAVRMGSIHSYDRRGTVVWMTDFRHGLQGATCGTSDAECAYYISAARSHFGGYSLKMDPSDESDSYVEWGGVVQFMQVGKIGLEAIISLDSEPDQIQVRMLYFDGGVKHTGMLRYDPQTGDWAIYRQDATWTTILSGFKLQPDAMAWNSIKLIVDVDDDIYVRAQMAKEEVDLSAYPLKVAASASLGQLNPRVYVGGSATDHAPIFVDGIIITQNE